MNTLAALLLASLPVVSGPDDLLSQNPLPAGSVHPSAEAHLAIHNIRPAHDITMGAGTRVGILGHSFEESAHRGLYAGVASFRLVAAAPEDSGKDHQGYWLALGVREIAPQAQIFAMEVPGHEKEGRVEALAEGLDWALVQDLDVVTYCAGSLSTSEREALGPVIEQAVAEGLVLVFVDYSHPLNLLTTEFGRSAKAQVRKADLSIFSYDCTSLQAEALLPLAEFDDDRIQRNLSFLAQPSSGAITAGLVALVRSVAPEASPAEVKRILKETSHSLSYSGRKAQRVPDAFWAVKEASAGNR